MQRLFSTFAGGWPGAGMLIQRLLVGTRLVYGVLSMPACTLAPPQVIGALAGVLLIAGLWTPAAAIVAACADVWLALSPGAHPGNSAVSAAFALTLAMIGPGEWSVDARLYGRRHFVPPAL